MNKVDLIAILVESHHMQFSQALDVIDECATQIFEYLNGDSEYNNANDIIRDYLNIEPTYDVFKAILE